MLKKSHFLQVVFFLAYPMSCTADEFMAPDVNASVSTASSARVVITFDTVASRENASVPENVTLVKQYGRRLVVLLDHDYDEDLDKGWLMKTFKASYVEHDSMVLTVDFNNSLQYEEDWLQTIGQLNMWNSSFENEDLLQTLGQLNMSNSSDDSENLIQTGGQWNLDEEEPFSIHPDFLWNLTRGKVTQVIGVLDGGLPDISLPLFQHIVPGYDFISDETYSLDGDGRDASFTDPGDAAPECPVSSWHGLQVTSVLAATPTDTLPFKGVCSECSVLPVRVLGKCKTGYTSDVADALVWATGGTITGVEPPQEPAGIITMSFTGYGVCPSYLQSAVTQAVKAGAILVAAAGNNAGDSTQYYPANCHGVVTVTATDRYGAVASYANTGVNVALGAPGGDSLNPIPTLSLNQITTEIQIISATGTSFSVPHVAGVLALGQAMNLSISSRSPKALTKDYEPATEQICAASHRCGTGILDAKQLIAWLPPENTSSAVAVIPTDTMETGLVYGAVVSNCPAGQYLVSGTCYPCPAGTYSASASNTGALSSCTACSAGLNSPGGSSACATSYPLWGVHTNNVPTGLTKRFDALGLQTAMTLDQLSTGPSSVAIAPDGSFALLGGGGGVNQNYITKIQCCSTTGTYTIIAGAVGTGAFLDDAVGTNARFSNPFSVSISINNTFAIVSDSYNHRIRKVSLLGTNAVSTLAGTGTAGTTDGSGSSATFYWPSCVAISPAQDKVVITSQGVVSIRLMSLSPPYTVSTLSTVAAVNWPYTISFSYDGSNFLVANRGSTSTILKFSYPDGTLQSTTTVTGVTIMSAAYLGASKVVFNNFATGKVMQYNVATPTTQTDLITGLPTYGPMFLDTWHCGLLGYGVPTDGTATCVQCAANYYSTGSGSCLACPNNTFSSAGAWCCTPPTGSYCTGGGVSATCPAGTFSASAGLSACTPCPAGQYSPTLGATSSATCTPCPAGKYSAAAGASACVSCPTNSNSSAGASVCGANAGFYDLGTSLMAYYAFDTANPYADSAATPLGALVNSGKAPTTQISGPWSGGTCCSSAVFTQTGTAATNPCSDFTNGQAFKLPSIPVLPTAAFTVCAWFMPGTVTSGPGYDAVIDFGMSQGSQQNEIWIFQIAKQNAVKAEVFSSTTTNLGTMSGAADTWKLDTWTHVCLSVSSSAILYVNGGQAASVAMNSNFATVSRTSNFIARSNTVGQSMFAGAVDEVRLYPRALTSAEVSAVYAYTSPVTTSMLFLSCSASCAVGQTGHCNSAGTAVCCVAGTYFQDGSAGSTCTLCPAGTYAGTGAGQSVSGCLPCPAGNGSASGASSCTQCGAGTYSTGGSACTPCAAGSYSTTLGATSASVCTQCPAGNGSASGASSCAQCSAGTYSVGGSTCTPCSAGQYSATLGATSSTTCTQCPAGKYLAAEGASACVSCPVNSNSSAGASTCLANPGFYDLGSSLMAYYAFDAANPYADSAPTPLGALVNSGKAPTTQISGPWSGGTCCSSAVFTQTGTAATNPCSDFTNGQAFKLPSIPVLPTAAFSVCAWFMPGTLTTGPGFDAVIDFGMSQGSQQNEIWIFQIAKNNVVNAELFSSSTSNLGTMSAAANTWKLNTWTHVCLSIGTSTAMFYVNGGQAASIATNSNFATVSRTSNFIARSNTVGQSMFAGAVDEVRLYPRALTSAEVSAIYAYTSPVTTSMLFVSCSASCTAGQTSHCNSARAGVCCSPGTYFPDGLISQTTCMTCPIGTTVSASGGACECSIGTVANVSTSTQPSITDNGVAGKQGTNAPGTPNYYYAFTSTAGTNSIRFPVDTNVSVLVVGGGGSGGIRVGGGGGAGGLVYNAAYTFAANVLYTVVVGAGGTGGSSTLGIGVAGGSSSIKLPSGAAVFYAVGGGAGMCALGPSYTTGVLGGSNGGTDEYASTPSATVSTANVNANVTPYTAGNIGGSGSNVWAGSCGAGVKCYAAGGGGGAGGAGKATSDGLTSNACSTGGSGGDGVTYNVIGSSVVYAAGGGGSANTGCTAGAGGSSGVGGAGGVGSTINALPGAPNTGSGGGGSGFVSTTNGLNGAGGSGVVIVHWSTCVKKTCTPGYYLASSGDCTACAAGSYSTTSTASSCTQCAAGYYSGTPGASSCTPCDVGYGASSGASSCTLCSAGTYSVVGSQCTQCAAGYYSQLSGASVCDQCPGSLISSPGTSSVESCTCPSNSLRVADYECVCNDGFLPVNSTTVTGLYSCVACDFSKIVSFDPHT